MTLGTMKKFFLTFGLLFSMLLTGCSGVSESLNGEKIIVGIDDEFAPMNFKNENNEIVGFDADLAKETIKRLGGEVEFKVIDWDNKEVELNSGNVDVLWNGLDITPERQEQMLFTRPYMSNRHIIFTHTGQNIKTEKDLAGKVIGTQKGTVGEMTVTSDEKLKNSIKELKTYRNFVSAFMALENWQIDAVICDEMIGRYYIAQHVESLQAVDIVLGSITGFAVAVAKGNTALRDKIQNTLDEMIEDGTVTKISLKWFGTDLVKKR